MNWFPQIGGGSIAQFPLGRGRKWRMVRNEMEDGARITLADAHSGQVEWRLSYQDLSDSETAAIAGLFQSSRGGYGAFGFVDPTANLLAWSEDLTRPDWQAGSLTVTGSIADPLGGHGAWQLSNPAAGELQCTQTIGLQGSYVACFSMWIRAGSPVIVALDRDGTRSSFAAGTAWSRVYLGIPGNTGAEQSAFSVAVPASATVQVFGMQVECQPYPSKYKPSGAAFGIYPETYFGKDELAVRATGPGLSATDLVLVSRC